MNLDDRAWEKASSDNKTPYPTTQQVQKAWEELVQQAEDEAFYYYNQDGRN